MKILDLKTVSSGLKDLMDLTEIWKNANYPEECVDITTLTDRRNTYVIGYDSYLFDLEPDRLAGPGDLDPTITDK